jgi:hypothetical protein
MKIGAGERRVRKVACDWRREPVYQYGLDILEASPIVALNDEKHVCQILDLLDVPPALVLLK